MEVIGTLKEVFETQVVSDKFKKREIVITTDGNTPYPQHVSFQLTQDKTSLPDQAGLNLGDEVKLHFNLRGREWNGPQGIKYFNTLEAWRIEKIGSASSNNPMNTPQPEPKFTSNTGDNDDLPFS